MNRRIARSQVEALVSKQKKDAQRSVLDASIMKIRVSVDGGQRDENVVNHQTLYVACRAYTELYEEMEYGEQRPGIWTEREDGGSEDYDGPGD